MTDIVVVGSNSFSGASFINYALKKNVSVIGISRSDEPHDVFLPYKWHDHSRFKFEKLDINKDLDAIIDLINAVKTNFVINFAAQSMVGESWAAPDEWFMTNTVSTIKLHDKLRKLNFIKRYVHVTTPEVYGSCSGFIKEDYNFNPSTPYAVSRAATDMSLRTFFSAYNFPVVSTRAANVYGPGQQLYRIIPRTILYILLGRKLQLHGGGRSERSFIHIEDVSDATWSVMLNGKSGDTYHIATKEVIRIRSLVGLICQKLGVEFDETVEIVDDRLGKDSSYQLDSIKVRSELDWQDKICLDQGIEQCLSWVKNNLDILKNQPLDYVHKS